MSAKLTILCGMIASGKSSYSDNASKLGSIIVNDDSILYMLHSNNYGLYSESLKILYKSIENYVISSSLMLGLNTILDNGKNCSKSHRSRFLNWGHSFDLQVDAIVFPNQGPEVHAKRRFEHDSRGFTYERWLEIANYHQANYSEPTLKEGFDKVYHISYQDILEGKVF